MTLDAVQALAEARASWKGADGRPFVTLSYAQSLDGSIAAADGSPLRLSNADSMTMTHRLRTLHDAILVGIGTLLADDPQLTVRLAPGDQPQPVIVDPDLRTPPSARVFRHPRSPWIAVAEPLAAEPASQLRRAGADLLVVRRDDDGHVDLEDLLRGLAARGIGSLLVEGGSRILHSFLSRRLVDWVIVTFAPLFVAGIPALQGNQGRALPRFDSMGFAASGPDVILWGRPTWQTA